MRKSSGIHGKNKVEKPQHNTDMYLYNRDMKKLTISKQSLIDWQIQADGKHVAWINKLDMGYSVQFAATEYSYFKRNFREAKAFALAHA